MYGTGIGRGGLIREGAGPIMGFDFFCISASGISCPWLLFFLVVLCFLLLLKLLCCQFGLVLVVEDVPFFLEDVSVVLLL